MWSAFTEIDNALIALGSSVEKFKRLPDSEAIPILQALKDRYLGGQNPTWWWEQYKDAICWNPSVEGYSLLPQLCPESIVLFIPHENAEERIYVGSPVHITRILGECAAFEYTVAGRDLDWLLTETHHNALVAVGDRAKANLLKVQNA
jgi:hypothetical protein